jgi:hypothetical protein
MASGFPASIDNFTDPLSNSPLNSPSHSAQHADVNDAVEKIETYMGLVKVIPTGATNGTVGATGTVTIGSAVTSVTVSGAFSSLYDNYRIIYQMVNASSAAELLLKFNNSTGSTYSHGGMYVLYGTATLVAETANNVTTGIRVGNTSTQISSVVFDVISPFGSTPTHVMSQHSDGQYYSSRGGRDSNVASQTAFSLTAGSGTMTGGTIRVYGYRN